MAFVKIEPNTQAKGAGRLCALEFGVGVRTGLTKKAIYDAKVRLRPKLLGAAQSFLVVNTWFDILFDADGRELMIKPGSDFKLYRPGGPSIEVSALMLAFPLPAGLIAKTYVFPVADFTATIGSLSFAIPPAAFTTLPVSPLPAPPAAPAEKNTGRRHPGFDSVLANIKHDVRRGT